MPKIPLVCLILFLFALLGTAPVFAQGGPPPPANGVILWDWWYVRPPPPNPGSSGGGPPFVCNADAEGLEWVRYDGSCERPQGGQGQGETTFVCENNHWIQIQWECE